MIKWIKNFLGIEETITEYVGTVEPEYTNIQTGNKFTKRHAYYKVTRKEDGKLVRLYYKDEGSKEDFCIMAYEKDGTLIRK